MGNDTEKIIRKICNALNANDLVSAKQIIERELKRTQENDKYYFYLALVTENLGEKLEYYTKAIEARNDFLDAYINRGLVKNELNDYEGSILDYNKAIELDRKCTLAYNNRGYTKFKQQDFKGALEDYNKAILLNPRFKMAMDNKAQLLQKVCLKDDKDFSEKYYMSLAIININEGNLKDADVYLQEVLKYNQNSALAYFYKGVISHSLGKEEDAYNNYTKSIEIDKNMIDAYYNRGQIIMKTKPKQALDDFVTAVALDSKFIDAYYSIAVIQKDLGEYNHALKNLERIIELEPNAVNAKALKKLILKKYIK